MAFHLRPLNKAACQSLRVRLDHLQQDRYMSGCIQKPQKNFLNYILEEANYLFYHCYSRRLLKRENVFQKHSSEPPLQPSGYIQKNSSDPPLKPSGYIAALLQLDILRTFSNTFSANRVACPFSVTRSLGVRLVHLQ